MRPHFLKIFQWEGIIALVFFAVFCICFIPSPGNEVRLHDTFDGLFTTRHVLIESGYLFETDPSVIVPGVMNGLPRGVFPGFTDPTTILMWLFGSLGGYSLTFILVRLVGFLGIYMFGKDHLDVKEDKRGLLIMISVAFACLPFFVIHGLTAAGIPLLAWAWMNLYKQQRIGISYLIFVMFGLWSSLVLVGIHLLLFLGILAVLLSVQRKQLQLPLFIALFLLTITYVLSNYMMFYLHYFDKSYHTFREGFSKELGLNFKGVIGTTVTTFFTGEYSGANYFGYVLIPFLIFFAVKLMSNRYDPVYRLALFFFITLAGFSFIINLLDWQGMALFYEKFSLARVFNFKRFTNLLSGTFYILLLIVFVIANRNNRIWVRITSFIVMVISFVFIWRGNLNYNRSGFENEGIEFKDKAEYGITWNEFFSPGLYRQVKMAMGADSASNLVHFDVLPSASKYAGIRVLDDYQSDYPMEYKTAFRKIIEKELDRSKELKEDFDGWGAKCYLRSADFFANRRSRKMGFLYEPNLLINTGQLKAMNCRHILSGALIGNSKDLNINMKQVVVNEYTHEPLFLYTIN